MSKLVWKTASYITFLRLLPHADGSSEYGQAIRWAYLVGEISQNRMNKLDDKNFKKWQKSSGKSYVEYLDVARV